MARHPEEYLYSVRSNENGEAERLWSRECYETSVHGMEFRVSERMLAVLWAKTKTQWRKWIEEAENSSHFPLTFCFGFCSMSLSHFLWRLQTINARLNPRWEMPTIEFHNFHNNHNEFYKTVSHFIRFFFFPFSFSFSFWLCFSSYSFYCILRCTQ